MAHNAHMSPLLNLTPAQLETFLIHVVPHHRQLGMRSVSCREGGMRIDLPWSERLAAGPSGGIHHGAITTLIDALSGSVVLTRMRDFRRSATLDLRMDFLRPALQGQDIHGEAEVLHMDGNVAFTRAVAHHGDAADPVAVSNGCFAVFKGNTGDPLSELTAPVSPFTPYEPAPAAADANPLQRVFDSSPYARMMDFFVTQNEGQVTGGFRYGPHLIGNPVLRTLHGGGVASLLSFTAAAQLMMQTGRMALPRLFNLNLEFLRQSASADAYARATVISCTRRFANVRVMAYQDESDQPITVATAQFALI
jgi:uncharacterized protein (TIGR00369 family)